MIQPFRHRVGAEFILLVSVGGVGENSFWYDTLQHLSEVGGEGAQQAPDVEGKLPTAAKGQSSHHWEEGGHHTDTGALSWGGNTAR